MILDYAVVTSKMGRKKMGQLFSIAMKINIIFQAQKKDLEEVS